MVIHWFRDLRSIWYQDIIRRKKQTPFIIFISFIAAFAIARLVVLLGPESWYLWIREYHIHHFYYGFALITIACWIALTTDRKHMMNIAAVLFGGGLGLFMDEFGLLLTCTTPAFDCDYYARQSYDAVMYVAAMFLAILYSRPFLAWLKKFIFRLFRRRRERF